MYNVLVPVGGVEGIILLGAEPEQDIAVVDVNAEGVDGSDGRVNTDVELVAVNWEAKNIFFSFLLRQFKRTNSI